ncbi:MAG: hypothetical protein DMG13_28555 [Acidobacteria bacterium]|nr:MAG: hypothetical protein DMG13_28555 [Acidobacteriota bacterium]
MGLRTGQLQTLHQHVRAGNCFLSKTQERAVKLLKMDVQEGWHDTNAESANWQLFRGSEIQERWRM